MVKITFLGAGSTVFAKSLLGDCICTPVLRDCEIRLYDIDLKRLVESELMLTAINNNVNDGRATIKTYCGKANRKDSLRDADFVVNSIQVGGYEPCTITDFEIPKKYGLRQTIADTMGIGGIMRALRTIPVVEDIAKDMQEVCQDALFLNYTNPMGMITGYMQRHTAVSTIGLCHSVQGCVRPLLERLGMDDKISGHRELIAGINHMAWLLEVYDRDGNDLYPEIKRRAREKNLTQIHDDMVRFEYIHRLGYYCTESSEHNAEYSPFFIKNRYPELIKKYNIPLDDYIRRCIRQIENWEKRRDELLNDPRLSHERGGKYPEYASYIIEAIISNTPFKLGGNVINKGGLIENLPHDACVEVPCMVNGIGINPCRVGRLPPQLAAMNMTNINVQLLTIEAAVTRKKEHIYHAAMLDPHTAAELSIDHIVSMVDELLEAHGSWLPAYR